MSLVLVTLVLAALFQTHGINAADTKVNLNKFTLNPVINEECTGYDPFISSTEYENKVYLHPWKTDERKGDWYHNRAYCAKHCAEMVTITSEEENTFFHQFIRNVGMTHPGAWLGAQIENKGEIRRWYNGEKFGYSPKAPGEYNEQGLTCLTVGWENSKNWWRNYYCHDSRYLIVCQRSAVAPTTDLPSQMTSTVKSIMTSTTEEPSEVSKIIGALKCANISNDAFKAGGNLVYQYDIEGEFGDITSFYLDFKNHPGKIDLGVYPDGFANILFKVDDETFVKLMKKEKTGRAAYFDLSLVIVGDLFSSLKLEKAMQIIEKENDVTKLEKLSGTC